MTIRSFALVAAGFAAASSCVPASAEDKVIGAIWEIRGRPEGAKEDVVRMFRATPDGKVWTFAKKGTVYVPKVIGTWTGTEEKTEITTTATPDARFNGKYTFTMVGKQPPTWQGKFTPPDGKKEVGITVKLLKD